MVEYGRMMKTLAFFTAVTALISSAQGMAQGPRTPSDTAGTTFIVRVENVSRRETLRLPDGGTVSVPLSAGVWAVHVGDNPIVTAGAIESGLGLKGLAEAGLAAPFAANLKTVRNVRSAGVFDEPKGHRRGMPKGDVDRATASKMLQPGQHFEFAVVAHRGERLSLAMMLAQSNDGIVATKQTGLDLFDASGRPVSGDLTPQLALWDAGTEINEPPGAGRNQGLRQGAPHAGDPERRPVRPLAEAEYGQAWPSVDRLVKLTITPKS